MNIAAIITRSQIALAIRAIRARDWTTTPAKPNASNPEGLETLGAWAGSRALAHPRDHVDLARRAGINRLDIILNDESAQRKERGFRIRDERKIGRLCELCHKAGIEVHYMSWLMPHARYLLGAGAMLPGLMDRHGAIGLGFDLEEPYTQAKGAQSYKDAGAMFGELFPPERRNFVLTGTGIRYASRRKIGPVLEHCDAGIFQAYSTRSSGADPAKVIALGIKQWRKRFPGLELIPGIAWYRQSGIKGYTPRGAILRAGTEAGKFSRVAVGWQLESLATRDGELAAAVRDIPRIKA